MSKTLGVPLVPYAEWLAALDKSLLDTSSEVEVARENPALRLIEFFFRSDNADTVPAGHEAAALLKLLTGVAIQAVECWTEEKLPRLSEKDTLSWVEYWRKTGFLAA